jgi:steroid delta-isomerase-like uncharacterized protein
MTSIEVARANVEAFNAGDWDRFRSLLDDRCVYDEPGTQRRIEGADAIVDANRGWREAFPDAHGRIEREVAADGTVTLEITWEGTQSGTLHTPTGDIPPSNRHVAVRAVQVIDVDGERIRESHHYFDMLGMLAQVGALPERVAATA